mmetsp:Transcript_9322/g.14300  ORF Transcript_9322/g.14300 Transcript_9322/m.14300 type:complete len:240 (-) Transcript_9322:286-1005(-)
MGRSKVLSQVSQRQTPVRSSEAFFLQSLPELQAGYQGSLSCLMKQTVAFRLSQSGFSLNPSCSSLMAAMVFLWSGLSLPPPPPVLKLVDWASEPPDIHQLCSEWASGMSGFMFNPELWLALSVTPPKSDTLTFLAPTRVGLPTHMDPSLAISFHTVSFTSAPLSSTSIRSLFCSCLPPCFCETISAISPTFLTTARISTLAPGASEDSSWILTMLSFRPSMELSSSSCWMSVLLSKVIS